MLSDDRLILDVRRLAAHNQRLPVLLLLAHVTRPAKTRSIVDKGVDVGFRQISKWNVTDILRGAEDANQVARRSLGWDLIEPAYQELASVGVDLTLPPSVNPSDSVLPKELFSKSRGYIEKVVDQINGSYDFGFYDCCAVMCRRLGETLIIEVYERQGRASEIKGSDDNFLMLSGLLGVLNKDKAIHLGRNAKRGLEGLACTRFRRHRVRCFYGTGGGSWRDESLHGSSSLRLCG